MLESLRPKFLSLVLFAAAYLLGAWLGHRLILMPGSGVTLWPPSGLYLAVLLLSAKRDWPRWILAGLPAEVAGDLWLFHFPFPAALSLYLGNTLEALVAASLVRRWCSTPFQLAGVREMLALILFGAAVSPILSATLGAATLAVLGWQTFSMIWPLWWIGDGVGVVIVAPLVVEIFQIRWTWRDIRPARSFEAVAMFAVFVVVTYLVFSGRIPFAYTLMLPLLWAALRFEIFGVALTTFTLSVIATLYTAAGLGRFANPAFDPEERQWLVQMYLIIVGLSGFVVAALTRQHRQALLSLERAHAELEARVTERTAVARENEERFRLFIEYAPAAVAMFDRDMRYLAASRRWLDEYRFEGEVLGRSHDDVFPSVPEQWKEAHRRALTGEVVSADEDRFVRADGSVQWMRWEVRPWHRADGHIGGIVLFTEDITGRKRAEMALRASEQRFRAIFEHAGTGIAIADGEGHVLQCNSAFSALLGYSQEELGALVLPDLVHPDDAGANLAAICRLREEELPYFQMENRYLRKDGATVWVRKFVSLLRESTDAPAHLMVLATDMTERHLMEEALRNADRQKDEFLAMLGHELRNPLAPIRNALYVLQKSGSEAMSDARAHTMFTMMERQVSHLVRLVDDLLEVSRITRGTIELKKERIDLAMVLGHAVETNQPFIQANGHDLSVSLPPEPLCLDADPVRLAQVFANLLNNAAKYTPHGGRIWLTAAQVDGDAVVSVRDTGIGIPAGMLPHVFDLFTQVDRALDRSQGGLGIGLALVRRLVELHGGRVEVHSDGPGRGSEFVVHLPLAAAVLTETQVPESSANAKGPIPDCGRGGQPGHRRPRSGRANP